MRQVRTLQTNFASGQLDPLMAGRSDTKSYANGAETLTNFMQLVQGGVKRRLGMEYLATIGEHARLIPFVFNKEQLYIFAMYYDSTNTEGRIKVYSIEGTLLTTLTGFDWDATTLETVRFTQRNDVIIFTHEDFPMTIVTRTGASSFNTAYFDFTEDLSGAKIYTPMYAFQKYDTTITPSAVSGSITLTTSVDHWTSDHVGARVAIHGQQCEITGYTSATQVTATVGDTLFSDQNLTISTAANFEIGEIVTQTDSEAQGEVIAISTGVLTIANQKKVPFKTQTTSHATVGGISGAQGQVTAVASVSPQPTRDWKEEVFSYARGWARSCLFHGQRLWFGGSRDLPAHLFSSKVSSFFDFDVGEALDDESIQAPIASDQVNSIQHLISSGHLQVFTDQAEFYCPETENNPLTPDSFNIRRQSSYGSAETRPLAFDRATLFVQNTGKVIREYKWEEIEGGYTPNAVSLIATNLLDDDGIVDTAVVYGLTNRPEQYAFFLNEDGTIAVYHAARNEQISSWSKWETEGKIIHICGMEGVLYAAVERTINGSTVTTLEKFSEDVTLDCAKQVTVGSKTASFTGFTHLADQEISVVANHGQTSDADYQANAFYLGKYTVASGGGITITGGYTAYTITAGFNFDSTVKTMPVDYGAADGQITGLPKKISTVDLLLNSTMGADVSGTSLILRRTNSDLSKPPAPITGRSRFYLLGWDKLGQVEVKSTVPLNFTLLGLMFEVAY
jgi:hypothetical protein